jgi:hypothetical protein
MLWWWTRSPGRSPPCRETPRMKLAIKPALCCWLAATMIASGVNAQDSSPPAATTAPLSWKRVLHLHDGRVFVSDGAIALDAALAKPDFPSWQKLPEANAKVVEGSLTVELPDQIALSELKHDAASRKYVGPGGLLLNAIYVDYLRRTTPRAQLRFRMKSDLEPVVILLDSKPVGLLMPMKSANR